MTDEIMLKHLKLPYADYEDTESPVAILRFGFSKG